MELIDGKITVDEFRQIAEKMYGNIVKTVIDIEKEIMAINGDLHADLQVFLLAKGSQNENLWGILLYPKNYGTENFLIFDSLINYRPSWGNKSRGIDDILIQKKIRTIVSKLVAK